MASNTTNECRLCKAIVDARCTTNLFSGRSLDLKWPSRIAALLQLPVDDDKQMSPYVCSMCIRRVSVLGKSLTDLQDFRHLAQLSLESRRSLKRTRVTCGLVGVSPDTARARPSSKLSRRQLFQCKYVHST